jgi:lipopolysaccharide transport system ATP-binding protein
VSDPAVTCRGVSKRYRIGAATAPYGRLTESISRAAGAPFRRLQAGPRKQRGEHIWALRNVDLDVAHGEVLGIVGRNGAGKSTLLKILSRITVPTEGEVRLYGRVGSLLEVGTGFHPELSGRENIYLNGAILGMRRADIRRRFDEIVEFAEIGRFLDTPVKRYSSGMYVRLAFAVAAHLEPEILVVDEVLAVGDAAFQRKCLGKMTDVAREGRTVLFVSHNMQAVKLLCTRAVLLDAGELVLEGETATVARAYIGAAESLASERVWERPEEQPGDDDCRLVALRVLDETGRSEAMFFSSQRVLVEFEVELEHVHSALCIGFDLLTMDGTTVFTTFHTDVRDGDRPALQPGRNVLRCEIPASLLNSGSYLVAPRITLHFIRWIVTDDRHAVRFDVTFDHGESSFLAAAGRSAPIVPVLDWQVAQGEAWVGEPAGTEASLPSS